MLNRRVVSTALLLLSLTALPLTADCRNGTYVVEPGLVLKSFTGPVTVVAWGNPFRYPWSLAINQQLVAGTGIPNQLGPTLSSGGSAGSGATAPGSPAQAGTAPGAPAAATAVTPSQQTAGSGIVIGLLGSPSLPSAAVQSCRATGFAFIKDCISKLKKRVSVTTHSTIQAAYQTVCSAQIEFLALQQNADNILANENFATDAGRATALIDFGALIGPAAGITLPNCGAVTPLEAGTLVATATVASANAAIGRIQAFPSQEVADETTALNQLQGAVASYTSTSLLAEESPDIKNPTPAQLKPEQAKLDALSVTLASIQFDLNPYLATGAYAQAYATAVQQMLTLRSTVLSNVTVSRFYSIATEDCTNLFSGGRTTTITVTRADSAANSVVVTCPTRAFTSAGYAFSQLPQRQYTAVATNAALPQAPAGSPTPPPARIEETSSSSIRPMPVVLLNVRLTAEETGDNGFYGSFGVSVNSSPTSTTIDYLGGISYSLSRSLIFTAGATLSPTNSLAPGYNLGDPATTANSNPPTITRLKSAVFLAITYGAH